MNGQRKVSKFNIGFNPGNLSGSTYGGALTSFKINPTSFCPLGMTRKLSRPKKGMEILTIDQSKRNV